MKVVLKKDVKDLGKAGELVNVSDGYAKNYLIPRKLAVVADAAAMNEVKTKEAAAKHRLEVEKAQAQQNADTLQGKTVKISANAGANGRLFGSVTSKEIAEKIKADFGIEIDKKRVIVDDIRNFGTYECTLKIYTGISATIYVLVGE